MKNKLKRLIVKKSTLINLEHQRILGGVKVGDSLYKDSLAIKNYPKDLNDCPTSYCTRSDQSGCQKSNN